MNDFYIIDNCLEEDDIEKIDKFCNDPGFPWFVGSDVSIENSPSIIDTDKTIRTIQFDQIARGKSFFSEISQKILSTAGFKSVEFKRLKLNLLTHNSKFTEENYNCPHVDSTEEGIWSMVVYMNDSDGDTVFFKERYDGTIKEQATVDKRITPEKGKAVIFKGDIFHASSNPIVNNKRIVLNVNFVCLQSLTQQ